MRVVGYVRVSTSAQTDAYGIDAQIADIERYCESHRYEILDWYIDKGVSGVKELRPQLDRLLYRACNPPIEAVVVAASDRIAREIELYYAIKHQMSTRGIKLISVREDFGYKGAYAPVLEALMAAMAEIERGAIKQRTAAGRNIKALSGGYAGGKVPYGYTAVNKELVIYEPEAEIVRLLFKMKSEHKSRQEMIDELTERGYRTRKGTVFSKGGIDGIFKHEMFYRGYYKYGDSGIVKGKQEILLTEC